MKQNLTNHIAFVLDASSSMISVSQDLIKVVDDQVKILARKSQERDQETRVTIYTFSYRFEIHCVVWDMDVLRLPSIRDLYKPHGNTALIDASLLALEDLGQVPVKYGNHSFLVYVLTDGQENASKATPYTLQGMIEKLDDTWTVAAFVPDVLAKKAAKEAGFPGGNVAIWDATNAAGVEEAGEAITRVTDQYMTMRSAGGTGTKTLFSMDSTTLNHKTVGTLKELTGFRVETVKQPSVIKPFIESLGLPFVQGNYFFPLIVRTRVSDAKQVLIRHKISGKIYGGPEARRLVGLPDTGEVSISPEPNGEYDLFIQSSSLNRKLIAGHDLLIKV